MYKEQLIYISNGIIHSAGPEEEKKFAKLLSGFLSEFSAFQGMPSNEVRLDGGVALSAYGAAICVDEYLRTARFIKGIYLAIRELIQRFPGEKINILYAGCGPYATLLVPLLPLFSTNEIEVVLLDIHEYSLQSVKKLVSKLKVEDYITDIIQGNAAVYKKPVSKALHMVIAETMFEALTQEPQVVVTSNLAPQLEKGGIFIPEEIKLDLAYAFFGKEAYFKNKDELSSLKEARSDEQSGRVILDTLFSMNKNQNFSTEASNPSHRFESRYYEIPKEFQLHPDICIFTSVRIFKHIELSLAESTITNPYCVTSIYTITDYSCFKLIYDFKDIPHWVYEVRR